MGIYLSLTKYEGKTGQGASPTCISCAAEKSRRLMLIWIRISMLPHRLKSYTNKILFQKCDWMKYVFKNWIQMIMRKKHLKSIEKRKRSWKNHLATCNAGYKRPIVQSHNRGTCIISLQEVRNNFKEMLTWQNIKWMNEWMTHAISMFLKYEVHFIDSHVCKNFVSLHTNKIFGRHSNSKHQHGSPPAVCRKALTAWLSHECQCDSTRAT